MKRQITMRNGACTETRNLALQKQRGQAYSMIRGQCMQVLLDKMKHDIDWDATSKSNDPLLLIQLIKKTILAQTGDQYPFATVYDQEVALLGFHQTPLPTNSGMSVLTPRSI